MKKIMFLVLMILITVIGTSQTIGDSYNAFMNSTDDFYKNVDDNGEGYLISYGIKTDIEYYFKNGVCNHTMIITKDSTVTDKLFDLWMKKFDHSYKLDNGLIVYVLTNGNSVMYRMVESNGIEYYVLEGRLKE